MTSIHSRHDGHQQKDQGYFNNNDKIARLAFWVVVVLVVALLGMCRLMSWNAKRRKSRVFSFKALEGEQQLQKLNRWHTLPGTILSVLRWTLYPRHRFSQCMSSISRGELLFLLAYLSLTWGLLLTNVFFNSTSPLYNIEWEVIGFRAAWIATAQLPLLYCTGGRVEPISMTTGVVEHTIKRFHVVVGINILTILVVHWACFMHIWDLMHNIIETFLQRPMVIWGFLAWSLLASIIVISLTTIPSRWYEAWYISHVILGFGALLLSYVHTRCTTDFVIAAICFIIINNVGKILLLLKSNLHLNSRRPNGQLIWGYRANSAILDHQYLQLRIDHPSFTWKPGQHLYIHVPEVRLFESHPFTVTSLSLPGQSDDHVSFIIKKQNGFTKALFDMVSWSNIASLHVNLLGPFGRVPQLNIYDTIVFIASGNRVSFIIPMIEYLCENQGSVTAITTHLIFPSKDIIKWYGPQIAKIYNMARQQDIRLHFVLHVTTPNSSIVAQVVSNETSGAYEQTPDSGTESTKDVENSAMEFGSRHDTETCRLLRSETAPDFDSLDPQAKFHARSSPAKSSEHNPKRTQSAAVTKSKDVIQDGDLPTKEFTQLLEANTKDTLATLDLQTFYGRPATKLILDPVVADSGPQSDIMVVAAVGQSLLMDISTYVSRVSKDIVFRKRSEMSSATLPASIDLWHESNGS